ILSRPRLAGTLPVDLAAQQKPPNPVSGAHQIHPDVLPAAHQIAQLLALHRRDPDQRQLPRGQQPGQADRVALIGLDPIRRRALGLARRAHPELDPLPPPPARGGPVAFSGLAPVPRRALGLPRPAPPGPDPPPPRPTGGPVTGRTRLI